jgi:tetratricopeptide (TPR) repeat protein
LFDSLGAMIGTDSAVLEERATRMRELLARERDDATTWFGLGQTLLALGRPAEAVEALGEAVRLRPSYTAAHRDLGRALLEAGRPEEADRVLERGARVAEETRDLQTGREIAVLLGRIARKEAPRETEPGPGAAPGAAGGRSDERSRLAALQLAREALRQLANGRTERAIALYQRAVEADPGLALAWNGLSVAWRHAGDLDRAIEAARRLVELEPDDALSHTNLSILYQSRGMIREAEEEKALAMRLQLRSRS